MLNQDIALDFSYTVFGAILRKNLPTFLKINMPGVRYQFGSFEEFFNDSEVQELTQDTADSQDAIAGLA